MFKQKKLNNTINITNINEKDGKTKILLIL